MKYQLIARGKYNIRCRSSRVHSSQNRGYVSTNEATKPCLLQSGILPWQNKHSSISEKTRGLGKRPCFTRAFAMHKGKFIVGPGELNLSATCNRINDSEAIIIDTVLSNLENLTGEELSDLTHSEDPWIKARKNVAERDYCNEVITKESIQDFYSAHPNSKPLFSR